MRLDRARIAVGAEQDREAGVPQPEAQAAGAAEEIDRRRPRRAPHPSPDRRRDRSGRARRMARQPQVGAAVVGDRGPAWCAGCGRRHVSVATPRPRGAATRIYSSFRLDAVGARVGRGEVADVARSRSRRSGVCRGRQTLRPWTSRFTWSG